MKKSCLNCQEEISVCWRTKYCQKCVVLVRRKRHAAYMRRARDKWPKQPKIYQVEWFKKLSQEKKILRTTKSRAKKHNIPFNLELADIVIPAECPILGVKFQASYNKGPSRYSPSIDRIKPELGYVKGNVQIVSGKANVMKNDATPEELKRFALWVQKTYLL